MKKLLLNILSLFCLSLTLCSCGLDLKEVYEDDAYNDPIFNNNYYRVYPKQINPDFENNIRDVKDIRLSDNQVALTYEEAGKKLIDIDMIDHFDSQKNQEVKALDYSTDAKNEEFIGVGYGPTKKMNRIDDMFKYGYTSKLFDGQIFCDGMFQLSRVQLDERGFGMLFPKEMIQKDYFAINFKSAINNDEENITIQPHNSSIDIHISFYLRDADEYEQIRVSYIIDEIPTNNFESPSNLSYVFMAFNLDSIPLDRCCGLSISYDLIKDDFIDENKNYQFDYAMMLYEIFMPNSSWR